MNEAPNKTIDRCISGAAWILWLTAFLAVAILVRRDPWQHNEGVPYAQGAADWWQKQDMYAGQKRDGFLYFPQFAIIYTPFEKLGDLGHPWGDVLWRLFGVILFCGGIGRFAKLLWPGNPRVFFAIAAVAAIAPAVASLRNGQTNLHIAGIMLLAAADLAQARWWRATFWLFFGLAVKPIILVLLLLVAVLYRPMSWRCAVALVPFLLLPFATHQFPYVQGQYLACLHKTILSSAPTNPFCDLYGMVWHYGVKWFGWQMPHGWLLLMQAAAALATLGWCGFIFKHWGEPFRAVLIFTFAAIYLMLFNPRTELSSYVILTASVALGIAFLLLDPVRIKQSFILIAMVVGLCCDFWAYKWTHYWLKQTVCIVFAILLIRELIRNRPPAEEKMQPRRRRDAEKNAENTNAFL